MKKKPKEPTPEPSTEPTQPPAVRETPPTTLGYPCRFRIIDMPSAPTIVLASHRQPQILEVHLAWFTLEHLAVQLVRGVANVPRDPEGIFTLRMPAIKLRSSEVMSFDEPGSVPVLFTPQGVQIGQGRPR